MDKFIAYLESEITKANQALTGIPKDSYPHLYDGMGKLRELKACLRIYVKFTNTK